MPSDEYDAEATELLETYGWSYRRYMLTDSLVLNLYLQTF
jgi:hypothetical protein